MAKSAGMNMRVFVDGYDISGDFQSFGGLGGGPAAIDVTGVDKEAPERIGGRRDGRMDATTHFNPESIAGGGAADRSHLVLRSLPLTDRMVMIAHIPSGAVWHTVCKQGNYDPTVATDGAITCALQGLPNGYGVESGALLTPTGKLTQGAAGNVTSVDFGAGANFGLQAWLQVFAFTGTSATVKLQQSSDNGVGDAWADVTGGAFAAATARGTQRIETARNQAVERYLRVTTTGTFTNLVFAVGAEVNKILTNF